jgi:hypothetical protein
LDEPFLREQLIAFGVPEHTHDGYVRYIRHGIRPGHFLTAVLENDLSEACARADEPNRRAFVEHVQFLYNAAPSSCWGSPDRVAKWILDHAGATEAVT